MADRSEEALAPIPLDAPAGGQATE